MKVFVSDLLYLKSVISGFNCVRELVLSSADVEACITIRVISNTDTKTYHAILAPIPGVGQKTTLK